MTSRNVVLSILAASALTGLTLSAASAQSIVSSVLPASRSVQVGATPATAFATIINLGQTSADGCTIAAPGGLRGTLSFATTDPVTNRVVGSADTPVTIPPGTSQSFVFSVTPSDTMSPTDLALTFRCSNAEPAATLSGVNTLLLSASTTPVPDVVALVATLNNDGVSSIRGSDGTGIFSVATVNVGTSGLITASADTGAASPPVGLAMCHTDAATGACLTPPGTSVTTPMDANATSTFAVFLQGAGTVAFDPAVHRVFVRFRDSAGVVRGATSVAVRTVADLVAAYRGGGTLFETGCQDPADNGSFATTSTLTITGQTGERLEGTTTITATVRGDAFNAEATFSGAITVSGDLRGTFSYVSQRNGAVASSGEGTFTGSGNGSDLALRFSGRASSGDTCTFDGQLAVQR